MRRYPRGSDVRRQGAAGRRAREAGQWHQPRVSGLGRGRHGLDIMTIGIEHADPERREHGSVESERPIEFANVEADMIEHPKLPKPRSL